jgi:hypothetical protein
VVDKNTLQDVQNVEVYKWIVLALSISSDF